MIASLAASPTRGVIRYQGQHNADEPENYRCCFSALVEAWRRQFSERDLPVYAVQLRVIEGSGRHGANFRLMQSELCGQLPHTDLEGIFGASNRDIHPPQKRLVGECLARLALHHD